MQDNSYFPFMRILAGMSGYAYKEWKGSFYPTGLPAGGMLGCYATRFPAVEINNTFYRMPKEAVLLDWAARVPDGFTFAIKASRRITHDHRDRQVAGVVAESGDDSPPLTATAPWGYLRLHRSGYTGPTSGSGSTGSGPCPGRRPGCSSGTRRRSRGLRSGSGSRNWPGPPPNDPSVISCL